MNMNTELKNRVKEYLKSHKEEIAEELSALVRIPSIKGAPEKDAPMGRECARMLEAAAELFKKNGFDSQVSRSGYYASASYGEGEKSIGIFTHGDVVPVGDGWTLCEPFEAKRIGDIIVGRGCNDNKDGIIIGLYILKLLKELDIKIKNRLFVYIGSNEEDGMKDIDVFASEMPLPDVSIVPDNVFPVCLGEKGICQFFYTSDVPFEDVLDFYGGEAYNIVLDKAQVILKAKEGLREEIASYADTRFEIDERDGKIYVLAKGVPAHAAHPDGSVNAAYIACELLSKCKLLCASDREILKNGAYFLSDIHGNSFDIASSDDKFGATTSANGMVKMKDGRLSFSCDVRYGSTYSASELERRINKCVGQRAWRVTEIDNKEGFFHERDNPFANAMLNAYRSASGATDKDFYFSGGGTYARKLKNAFSIGTASKFGADHSIIPEGHGGAHKADEFVHLDELLEGILVSLAMLLSCDEIL